MFCLRVIDVIRHSDKIATLVFDRDIPSFPGQFVMLNVFGYEEIPLSLSSRRSVTVKAVGETTRRLVAFKSGEVVGIRGPFGRPFTPSSKALIIAGGIGIAPLKYLHDSLVERGAEVKVIYGARSADELIWMDEFEDVLISTDDGSLGVKGTVLEILKQIDVKGFERIYCCGPEVMMVRVFEVLKKEGVVGRSEFSLERYMRCGIGVCGSCVVKGGLRVCKEGPVFPGDVVAKIW